MVLKNIMTTTKYFKTIEKFTCKLEDCKIGRNEQDDHSIANIKHTVDGTRFIFEMRYIHGYSTGRVIYDVNGKTIIFSFVWNEKTWSISVNDQVVFEKSGAFVKAHISIARELINIELYPDIQPMLIIAKNRIYLRILCEIIFMFVKRIKIGIIIHFRRYR